MRLDETTLAKINAYAVIWNKDPAEMARILIEKGIAEIEKAGGNTDGLIDAGFKAASAGSENLARWKCGLSSKERDVVKYMHQEWNKTAKKFDIETARKEAIEKATRPLIGNGL